MITHFFKVFFEDIVREDVILKLTKILVVHLAAPYKLS